MKKQILILVIVIFASLFVTQIASAHPSLTWWDSSWCYKRPIEINYTGDDMLTNYQICITVDTNSLVSAGELNTDGSDFRIVNEAETATLPFWNETAFNQWDTKIWVNASKISDVTNTTIYMYYGNPTAASAFDGDATFEFFDDFAGTSLDTNKWNKWEHTSATVADSEVHIVCKANNQGITTKVNNLFPLNRSVEYRERFGEADVLHARQGFYRTIHGNHRAAIFSAFADGGLRTVTINDTELIGTYIGSYNTSYYRYHITMIPGGANFYRNGELKATHTTGIPPGDLKVQFNGANGANMYLDWVFVRKCAPSEPTYSIGVEESYAALGAPLISDVQHSTPTTTSVYVTWNTNQSDSDNRVEYWRDVWEIESIDTSGDVGTYTSLALDNNDYPHVSYYDAADGDLKYVRWNGSAWTGQMNMAGPDIVDTVGDGDAWVGDSLQLDNNGYPHISYYDAINGDLKYVRWNGSAWVGCVNTTGPDVLDTIGDVGAYTSLELDNHDYPHVSYRDYNIAALKYVRWNGSAWIGRINITGPDVIDSGGEIMGSGVGKFNSLALGNHDYPHISYFYYYSVEVAELRYVWWNGSAWIGQVNATGPDIVDTYGGYGDVGAHNSLALDSYDYPHISYRCYTIGGLKYARWNGSTWVGQVNMTGPDIVDSTGETNVGAGRFTSLALDNIDSPRISYYDVADADLKYVKWNGSMWIGEKSTSGPDRVDTEIKAGIFTSIALDKSWYPHISYYEDVNGNLKYARWKETLWSSWHNNTDEINISLTGLNPSVAYHYQVWSYNGTDSSYNCSSPIYNFTTAVPTWWNNAWSKRRDITIINTENSNSLDYYPVLINLSYDSDMNANFSDVRFVNKNNTIELSHWIEDSTASYAKTWVKVPRIPALGNTSIYVYYGNPTASSTSTGNMTFDFFDDFLGTSLDEKKWEKTRKVTVTVADSAAHIACNADFQGIMTRGAFFYPSIFTLNNSVEFYGRYGETNMTYRQGFYRQIDSQEHASVFDTHSNGNLYALTINDDATITNLGAYDTTYHRYHITRKSGEAKFYQEGDLLTTHTTDIPPDSLIAAFLGDNGANMYLDWVFVRKYSAPEPICRIGLEGVGSSL